MLLWEKIIPLIYQAGDIAMSYFNKDYDIQNKADKTPVTQADIEISNFLSEKIVELFPQDRVFSEENLQTIDDNGRVRTLDPIDGTKNFIAKEDSFSIMLWCVENGESVFGLVYFPVKKLLYIAERGKGCFRIGENWQQQIMNRSNIFLQDAKVCYKPSIIRSQAAFEILQKIQSKTKTELRPTGYIATQVLDGKQDLMILAWGYSYELATLEILFKEAGLVFESWTTKKKIVWTFGNPKISDVILVGQKDLVQELSI